MATTFIDFTEEDELLDLASYIDSLNGHNGAPEDGELFKTVDPLVKDEDFKPVLIALVKATPTVFEKATSKQDFESFFTLIMYLATVLLDTEDEVEEVLMGVSDGVLAPPASVHPAARLAVLASVYNTLAEDSPLRAIGYKNLVRLAVDAGAASAVAHHFSNIDSLLAEWKASEAETRDILLLTAEGFKAVGNVEKYIETLVRHLSLFKTAEELTAARETAARAVVDAVAHPRVYNFASLHSCPAVMALEGPHRTLLDLFATNESSLADFDAFVAGAGASLFSGEKNLDAATCRRKMQLLCLTAVCSSAATVAYADITAALDISEDEVEMWVIDAISAGLLEATMDQVTATVSVTRAAPRAFIGWDALASKLEAWQTQLTKLRETVDNARYAAGDAMD